MLKTDSKSMSESLDECLAAIANIDDDYAYCSEEQLLSDDIWKKFEFEPLSDLSSLNDIFRDLDAIIPDDFAAPSPSSDLCEIRNHDCMWAGHCGSKEHPADELASIKPQLVAPVLEKTPVAKQQPVAAGRSLLLKTVAKTGAAVVAVAAAPVLPSPESPPISDDEDPKQTTTTTLQMLNDAIEECDIDEDSDLCEYFEGGEDIVADEPEEPPQFKARYASENDHSYHDHSYYKDKNATMRMANLGIETPSDSEEEIDVVSVGEKQNVSNRLGYALPTNPSNRDRQQLQRTVASAITNKHMSSVGVKTSLPTIRKYSTVRNVQIKKRMPEGRGVKRTKQHYYRTLSSHHPPSKRRATHTTNSSDSEPELEKRSLHNNMERQRRIDLRNSFEDLRQLVPEVSSRERAAKVVILREAALYCDHLGEASDNMQRKVQDLRKRQEYLRIRVSQLRKSLAAKR